MERRGESIPFENYRRCLMVEFVGTLALVMGGASTAVASYFFFPETMNPYYEHILIGVTVSIIVSLSILLFGKISGALINPAITVSYVIRKVMPRKLLVPYIAVQLIASVVAGVLLDFLYGSINSPTHFGSTMLKDGATPLTGTILEIVGTIFLTLAALFAAISLKDRYEKQALLVGLVLFVLTAVIGPFTGASFNPARSLGPALASMIFKNQYVYWIGPFAGAVLAAYIDEDVRVNLKVTVPANH
jgi:MIP family channel proteins